MTKRSVISIILVYICWAGLDMAIHGALLGPAYEATSELWRPMDEIMTGLLQVVTLVSAAVFVLIYALWFREHDTGTGIKYGLLFGVGAGISMGYGTYAVMDIPYRMALTWFLGTVVQAGVAGLLVGLIIKKPEGAKSVETPEPPTREVLDEPEAGRKEKEGEGGQ